MPEQYKGIPQRFSLLGVIGGLMVADNLGDVHEEINLLRDIVGLPQLQGNFVHGWTEQDWEKVRDEEDD